MSTSPSSVLVIDDDEIFRRRLARALNDRGCKVYEARCGASALEVWATTRPEAVVLDLRIGEESGLTLLEALLDADATLKVVLLTGYGSIATAVQALKLGALNYLTKPTDADSVLRSLGAGELKPKSFSDSMIPDLSQVEWDHIQRVVNGCEGNISQAAKILGLHRRSLQRKLAKDPGRLK